MTAQPSPARRSRKNTHPGELIADDIRRLGLSYEEVALSAGISVERLRILAECDAYPHEKESARLGPVLGRGRNNLYRWAQAHRWARAAND